MQRLKKKNTIWLVIMLCWWGFLFPELTFTEDSLRVVYTEEVQGEKLEDGQEVPTEVIAQIESSQWDKYVELLSAEPEQVKIKSRLLEWLKDLW